MREMLKKAEGHSLHFNYRFNPPKCEVMNGSVRSQSLYDCTIPILTTFRYLGCIFDKHVIRWDLHLVRIEEKINKVVHLFRSMGYNGSGFRERTKIYIFKAFIRSTMEYCLAVMPPLSKWIGRLDRLQHKSLCTIVSVNKRVSFPLLPCL